MAEKIIMPKAGMAMETGTIVAWLKEVGDFVSAGEPLLEIETDKTIMSVESMSDGYILSKLYDEGAEVPVVTTIGYIGEQGETPPEETEMSAAVAVSPDSVTGKAKETTLISTPVAERGQDMEEKYIPTTPLARTIAREKGISLKDITAPGVIRARDVESFAAAVPQGAKATPLAARVAQMQGVDLSSVAGSGRGGKIFSSDLPTAATEVQETVAETTSIPLSVMRKTIATRMLRSHTEIPPVTLNTEADVTRLWDLRKELNDYEGVRISFNDLVIKAAAITLSEFPVVNASFEGDAIRRHEDVNIGVAVALDEGLIVPVIRNANLYSLLKLSEKAKDIATRARENKLTAEEYTGGTFTISNLGMFGISSFTPIINQPEAAILGVCAIQDKLMLLEDGIVTRKKSMGLSLTMDHRCFDGADGAKFLQRLVNLLENPMELIL